MPLGLRGLWGAAWRLARRKPLGAVSAVIILGLVVVAILAPLLAPRDPYQFNLQRAAGCAIRMQAPPRHFRWGRIRSGAMC